MRLRALQSIFNSVGEIDPGQEFTADDGVGGRLVEAGKAERLPDADDGPFRRAAGRWARETVVCIGSGPSLDAADCGLVFEWRERTRGKVIAINTTYREGALWADVLYFGDVSWWRHNKKWTVTAERWTQSEKAHLSDPGIKFAPDVYGPSSGHQAISLAAHFGASRIVLLGYDVSADNGRQQWHAPHHNAPPSQPYGDWVVQFALMAEDLAKCRVTVVNCTRRTALKCFPRVALQDELESPVLAS